MDKNQLLDKLITPAKGIIFDFDGILADSEKYHFLSYREVFRGYGHEIDETEYYKYWTSLGRGAQGEIERHGLDLDPSEITEEKRPIYSRYCRDGSIRLYDEAGYIVNALSRSGKKMAIASGSHREDIEAVLENGGISNTIPVIVGKNDVQKTKPDPEVLIKTLVQLGLKNTECVVLEDAEKGMFAAAAAGVPVIVIRTAETGEFDFTRADLVLDSLAELKDWLVKTS